MLATSTPSPRIQSYNGWLKWFWEGHGFTTWGKTRKCAGRRGRAALQGRVSRAKSARALAPVVVFPRKIAFSRKWFSPAAQSHKQSRL